MDAFLNPEVLLKSVLDEELQHQKKGEYKEAEDCRLKYLKQKEELNHKGLENLNQRHKNEKNDLKKTWNEELANYNQFWDGKMDEFEKESEKLRKELDAKHQKDYNATKENLDRTLPIKLKESSELLNLRKMEQHLAKQKNYVEAKKVQDKIANMLGNEKNQWDHNRKVKLETALETLKGVQKTEMTSLNQKIANSKAEKNKERKREEEKINLKYENFMVDLQNKQLKEVLAFKGEFRTLGGSNPPSQARSRTTFSSSR